MAAGCTIISSFLILLISYRIYFCCGGYLLPLAYNVDNLSLLRGISILCINCAEPDQKYFVKIYYTRNKKSEIDVISVSCASRLLLDPVCSPFYFLLKILLLLAIHDFNFMFVITSINNQIYGFIFYKFGIVVLPSCARVEMEM